MPFQSMETLIAICEKERKTFARLVLESECQERNADEQTVTQEMGRMWTHMLSASQDYDRTLHSKSGLAGSDGGLMQDFIQAGRGFCGPYTAEVMAEAIMMGESNACMRQIVAAPTAGSCGVLPAVLIPYYRKQQVPDERMAEALFVAAGIGKVIAERAFIAGASGGCQAEIGAASAMAAGALVSLKDGTVQMLSNAVAMALKNLLGLVCDPVAGLVEVPCIKRNVIGALNAMSCADMALAGIQSRIPADQIIDAMREVGEDMNPKYKETAQGGCATTPKGIEAAEKIQTMSRK